MPIEKTEEQFQYKTLKANNQTIAYRVDGRISDGPNPVKPNLLFLPGFFSDMMGSKASFLAARCIANNRQLTRFDYSGHGKSSGQFIDGCIGDWFKDALAVLDEVTTGKLILVGSSMGGWIMLMLALARPERVQGLVGIAAAPDFTEDLMWDLFTPEQKTEIQEKGVIWEPSEYGAPVPYTLKLVQDGREHLVLRAPIAITAPVRLIQGKQDKDVPWETAEKLRKRLQSKDVRILYVEDGEHRLSRDEDLELLWKAVESL
ncbi:MAG: alpha/beta hydrolase [Alphaproteobacteria bacterium]|nr:alpha/beta hydrolase [Alphaproteobacteria bacterium]